MIKKIIVILILLQTSFSALSKEIESTNLIKANTPKTASFLWGADIGSSIDVSGNDMSSIDADVYFGYKNKFFRALGFGAGIRSSLGSNHSFIPVYFLLRTSFRTQPSLCFLDLRAGYSFNNISALVNQSGYYGSIGCGFNLYTSSKFKSHLILNYNYIQLEPYEIDNINYDVNSLSSVSVKIGISF